MIITVHIYSSDRPERWDFAKWVTNEHGGMTIRWSTEYDLGVFLRNVATAIGLAAAFEAGRVFHEVEREVGSKVGRDVLGPFACEVCQDSHYMYLEDDRVLCTRCPTPCMRCVEFGGVPYCRNTPCICDCHVKKDLR